MPSIPWEVIVIRFNRLSPIALAASMAFVGAAQAGPLLDSSMYGAIAGTQNVTLNGVTFTSAPGNFIVKNLNGFSGLGVTGGRTGDEIDIGETVGMSFAAQVVSDFSLAFLYNGPEFGDWREIAQVTAYNGAAVSGIYTLTVGNDGAVPGATWSGIGTVTNLASRLCQHARPGEILLSQRVHAEIEGRFSVEDMGEIPLSGFSRPMQVYRCVGAIAG